VPHDLCSAWPQRTISLDALSFLDGLSIWSGSDLQSFGDNYVACNSDGDAAREKLARGGA
jgi:hypothetical protein